MPASYGNASGDRAESHHLRLVAYLRVSTAAQADTGSGLDVQRRQIETWADAHGHRIVEWFADEGVSGSNGLETRPGIFEAMSALKRPNADGLVVAKLDRLARDLVIQETLIAEANKAGGRVLSTLDGENDYLDDEGDSTRTLVRQILGAVAQYERGVIAARMRAGRQLRAEQGNYAGHGSPPYGWMSAPSPEGGKRLVPAEGEQATLARIRQLRDEGASTRQMADVLTEEGHRTRKGGAWFSANIARLLKRLDEVPNGAALDVASAATRHPAELSL